MNMSKGDRPSLYSHSEISQETEEVFSILDSLDPVRPAGGYGRRIVLAALMVLITASTLVMIKHSRIRPPVLRQEPNVAASRSAAAGKPVVAPTPPTAVAVVPDVPPASVAATVAGDAVAATTPSDGVVDAPHQTTPLAALMPQPVPQSDSGASAASPHAATEAAVANGVNGNVAHTTASKKKASQTRSRSVHASAHAAHAARRHWKAKSAKSSHKGDEDVDLIAALLSRVSHQDAKAKKGHESSSTVARHAASDAQKNQERNREIVVRQAGDSTEALVRRCRALGVVEGELCRIRICSGNWGKDPACTAAASN